MKAFLLPVLTILLLAACGTGGNRIYSRDHGDSFVETSDELTRVQTKTGPIVGYIENGIYIYKGIPYAQADRFMAPEATKPWEEIRSCRSYGPVSPQPERDGWEFDQMAFWFDWNDGWQGENCLNLNVWTPGLNSRARRPVMVWLHGGGFSTGSSHELPSYDGKNLALNGDVVVVSVNHRLNVLGYLDLSAFGDKYSESGNAGMLDLVMALEWIKNNIAAFGGDPGNVTIFGQSGGGSKVAGLMTMPSAKDLFHKAIIQSSSRVRFMEPRHSRTIGIYTLEEAGLKSSEVEKLSSIPYKELIAAAEKAMSRVVREVAEAGYDDSYIRGWCPVVDGRVIPEHPFLLSAPVISAEVPLMTGSTIHEFMPYTLGNPAMHDITITQANKELATIYNGNSSEFIAAFAKAYPKYNPRDLLDVDLTCRPVALHFSNRKSEQGGAPVYNYIFGWESPVLDNMFRAFHCIELPFVFDNAGAARNMTGGTIQAFALAEKVSKAWLNFARSGNPGNDFIPNWDAYTEENGATMWLGNECHMLYGHDSDLMKFSPEYSP